MSRRLLSTFALAIVVVLGLAACGSDEGSGAKDPSTIRIDDSSLGDILVDGSGRTLYLFTVDGEDATSSKCDAACLKMWPPVEGEPKVGDGVDADLIGTTTGGSAPQATYAGHPLYYYAKDTAAGEVNGQGVGKVWYVLDSKGAAITKAAPSPSGGGGGY